VSTDKRFELLEQRVATLERLVRQLAGATLTESPREATPVERPAFVEPPRPVEAAAPPPEPAAPEWPSVAPSAPPRRRAKTDSEQWLGQRGLLAVGVIFVVVAAGFLLKLSFDRGWISPLVRCIGGALAGIAVGAIGWRLHEKGLRTYGAALIGAGGAIVYLAVWAGTRLYGFLPPFTGIVGLALVSVAVAFVAYAINREALGATAVLGAFFAPILLGKETGSVNALLLYLATMAIGLGWVSAQRHWRIATFLVALSYFGIATSGILREAATTWLFSYALLGGAAGLFIGLREGWWETRLLSFAGGWGILGIADDKLTDSHRLTALGGLVLAAPVWWRAWRASGIWAPGFTVAPGGPRISIGETFYFYITPILLGWALHGFAPDLFDRQPGLIAAIIGIPYLLVGYGTPRRAFAMVGTSALAAAAMNQWTGLPAVWALLALTLIWAAADHKLNRDDGRWYSLIALALALTHLIGDDLPRRDDTERAFVGPWALALWATCGTIFALAAGLLKNGTAQARLVRGMNGRALLWLLGGVLVWLGVTGELITLFDQSSLDDQTANLASGLSVSAWWIAFAGGLVAAGFRRSIKVLRQAGMAVLGIAVLKVVFSDLSSLDALYRVGSAFILGLVSLGLAYLYHQRARVGTDESST
jgi:hypothetical protein